MTVSTTTSTICGDACPLSCASAEAYKLAQCTNYDSVNILKFLLVVTNSYQLTS